MGIGNNDRAACAISGGDCCDDLHCCKRSDAYDNLDGHHDKVNSPRHYVSNGIEAIEAIEAAVEGLTGFEGVCTGNVFKYMWRWKQKNGVEDLRKARWYLERLISSQVNAIEKKCEVCDGRCRCSGC